MAGLVTYAVFVIWLPTVVEKDMARRGLTGWGYDFSIWFIWWFPPVGLLAWWQARRRYPVLESAPKKPSE